jgi:P2 family phage contractile tail tube protein
MLKPEVLRNMSIAVDGVGQAGAIMSIDLPEIVLSVEDYKAGGLDMPIEVETGMEKLSLAFTVNRIDSRLQAGLGKSISYTVRGALDSDGEIKPFTIKMRGRANKVARGTLEAGSMAETTVEVNLRYYEEIIDGKTVTKIDAERMIRVINGVDQLAEQRAAIGV